MAARRALEDQRVLTASLNFVHMKSARHGADCFEEERQRPSSFWTVRTLYKKIQTRARGHQANAGVVADCELQSYTTHEYQKTALERRG
jgi:hypothetical protein